jgi:hypothetical protein
VPDELADALFVHGEPAAIREQLTRFVDAGVTTPILSIMDPSLDADALRSLLRELAPR